VFINAGEMNLLNENVTLYMKEESLTCWRRVYKRTMVNGRKI